MLRSQRRRCPVRPTRPCLEVLEDRRLLSGGFLQTNLVSDIAGMAATQDTLLINPWGLTSSSTSPFWVSDNATGFSTLYNGQGTPFPPGNPLVVTIPPAAAAPHGTPTGTVFNTAGTGFDVSENGNTGSSIFLFDTLDGTISGWNPGVDLHHAIVEVNNPGSVYTGLAIGVDAAGQTLLYAANHSKGTIDVFNSNFTPVTNLAGSFTDPNLPAGADPFNIQNINGKLYVEYTVGGTGTIHGAVDVFTTDGQPVNPMHPLIVGGALDSPWGVTLAPAGFGRFSKDLLVGNFGDGHINAFNPHNGHFVGELTTSTGAPFEEDHLWALRFGNGANAGSPTTLFFTAGINNEKDGLFGSLQAIPDLSPHSRLLPNLPNGAKQAVSTLPPNGDLNPYGVAFVPQGFEGGGMLHPGDILVSNFNDSTNTQGTGSTIVRITPDGQQSVFFQGPDGLGLTTALGVLKGGFVLVGNVPQAADGTVGQGSLMILDSSGHVVQTLSDSKLLNGPWDLTVNDHDEFAQVFVSNVLSGTVTRIDLFVPDSGTPQVLDETQIASGYAHRPDPNALVVGPTGLAFDPARDVLYVASTADNAIFAIPNAAVTMQDNGTGQLVVQNDPHLHGPLGLVLAPNGDLIASNGDAINQDPNHPNELVEFTPKGKFVAQFQLDPGTPGGAFGLALSTAGGQLRFAAVDDNPNQLITWTFNLKGSDDDQGDEAAAADRVPVSDTFPTGRPPSAADRVFGELGGSDAMLAALLARRHHDGDSQLGPE
jgi:uncharacterized protein (TIGR03118 family)